MALRNKLTYQRRLFLLLLAFSWMLVACFIVFQYGREKRYKADWLDGRLQLFNMRLADALESGMPVAEFMASEDLPVDSLRVSIVDVDGTVIFDNSADRLPTGNHLTRPEIVDALRYGTGFTVRRHSQTTDGSYFYSAMKSGDLIVRSAVPYSDPLRELLAADKGFLWFMLGVTLVFSVAGFIATRRLGHNIARLSRFAKKAERGEKIYVDEGFPHDELGEISSNIVKLYARLQEANIDRARQHDMALHEEQEKIRIKKQLTNNINHELKTPVASIQVCVETLLAHPELPDGMRVEFLERCNQNVGRLRRLLDDVSTITRLDDGSRLIQTEPVVINDLIRDLVADTGLNGMNVEVVRFDVPVVVNGSQSLLSSVFRNLLDNAVAYSGGKTIRIELIASNADSCRIRFYDDGNGVPEEHLPHLFERFYRVDKGRSRRAGGTGLGLSIVRNAVMFHGGDITVRNRTEGGLEFEFTLAKRNPKP